MYPTKRTVCITPPKSGDIRNPDRSNHHSIVAKREIVVESMSEKSRGDLPPGFYSAVPQERVVALSHTTSDLRELLMAGLPSWPRLSPGSLNAWLVFLGPSPGNSPGGSWIYDPLPAVGGAHSGVAEYVDRNNFWNGIRLFARTIFPELSPIDAYAATMVRNFDPEQSATAPTGRHMYSSALQVTEILGKLIRPRLVIALGGARVHSYRAFRRLPSAKDLDCGTLFTARTGNKREWFSLVANWESGDAFLYVSPSGIHPSRPHVSHEDALKFLRHQAKVARAL